MWPGSAQTALLFVGLPLLMALVLMAAPLHDGTRPPLSEDMSAALAAEAALTESVVAPVRSAAPPPAPQRQAAASRARRAETEGVPAVIFETRRTIAMSRERLQEALRSSTVTAPPAGSRRRPQSEVVTVAAFDRPRDRRAASAEPQSP